MKTQSIHKACTSKGFTLIEILLVVAVLGIIAALVIPTFAETNYNSQQTVFATDLKIFADAAWYYNLKTGEYPADATSGQCPVGFETYIDQTKFAKPTTIGGVWDFELDSFGIKSGVGVHFDGSSGAHPGDAYMQDVDALFDDGNLATGLFRKIADDRYYIVLKGA